MATPAHILTKVKFLINLSASPNPNEAATARATADKLISKYLISEEELRSLEDKKPLYGDNELLYHTFAIVGWMNKLALAVATHFDCYIVQEETHPATGGVEYSYFVYGGEDEEEFVKFVYHSFHKKVHHLIDTNCIGRGPIYVDSYCEGVVEGIKSNIEMEGIDIPYTKVPARPISPDKQISMGPSNLAKHKEEKERPYQKTVDVSRQGLIKDVHAFFKGVQDGNRLSLRDILELEAENEEAARLQQ